MDYDPNTNPFDLHFSGKLPVSFNFFRSKVVVIDMWIHLFIFG